MNVPLITHGSILRNSMSTACKRTRPVARRGITSVGLAVLTVTVTGCVPVAANQEPLAMSLRDGVLRFTWCGHEALSGEHLAISYEVDSEKRGPRLTVAEALGPSSWSGETRSRRPVHLRDSHTRSPRRSRSTPIPQARPGSGSIPVHPRRNSTSEHSTLSTTASSNC
jgi:hypothetical protein